MTEKSARSLTLVHKSLALVLVPFLFSCVWLLMLFSVLDKAHRLAEMERQQSRFIEALNSVLKESYQTRESFIGFIATDSPEYLGRADKWIRKTEYALEKLEALPDLSRQQKVLVSEMEEVLVNQFKQIRSVLQNSKGYSRIGLLEEVEPVTSHVDSLLNQYPDTEAHLAQQRKDLEFARQGAERTGILAKEVVIFGLLGNLLVALLLVFLIKHDLAKRLSRLTENTRLLPRRKELGQLISGGDELAALDRTLHEAAGELSRASDFRKSLMQMVAHDIRSPLTSCLISVDLLDGALNGEKERRQIDVVKNNLDRVIDLTNDLLLIEQFENAQLSLSLEPENMQELVAQAVLSVSAQAGAKRIKIENQSETEYVLVDRKRIIQVLVNYLSNAVKFSPTGSTVTVSSMKVDGALKVLVKDCGIGVRAEDKEQLFERFFQAKAGMEAGGSGLGLAISKIIIGAHGGSVGVNSELGKGALFWFTVPVGSDENAGGKD